MIDGYRACTRSRRCPICGRGDWCIVSIDGVTAICPRTSAGSKRQVGDAGFLHVIDQTAYAAVASVPKAPPRPPVVADWEPIVDKYERNLALDQLHTLAVKLRVRASSLAGIRIGFSHQYDAFTFPMSDATGKVIGIRVRNMRADKWCVPGSRNGLFLPTLSAGQWEAAETVWVVEGPTDLAAMLDLGFYTIGRPSCSAGVLMTCQFLAGKNVVIVSNYDDPKTRDNGTVFYPGQEGTAVLANALLSHARTVRVIYPRKGKDVREWKRMGATASEVQFVADCATPWHRKEAA